MSNARSFSMLAAIIAIFSYGAVLGREGMSIRCDSDTKLIHKGAVQLDVLSKCGPPDLSESSGSNTAGQFQSKTQHGRGNSTTGGSFRTRSVLVEKWYYNCGEGRFNKTLVFVGGILRSIDDGERGTGPNKCMQSVVFEIFMIRFLHHDRLISLSCVRISMESDVYVSTIRLCSERHDDGEKFGKKPIRIEYLTSTLGPSHI